MTEDEAKTKWCPFARQPGKARTADGDIFTVAVNRPPLHMAMEGAPRCIGSDCMAWRTDEVMGPQRVHPNVLFDHWKGWSVTNSEPDENGYVEIKAPLPAGGYCGLAGKPD
jgi:hypothetical protein